MTVNKNVYMLKRDYFKKMVNKSKKKNLTDFRKAELEVQKAEKKIKKEKRFIFHQFQYLKKHHQVIFGLVIIAGVIFIWRGLWNLMDLFWLRDSLFWSSVSGVVLGLLVLYLSHRLIAHLAGN